MILINESKGLDMKGYWGLGRFERSKRSAFDTAEGITNRARRSAPTPNADVFFRTPFHVKPFRHRLYHVM
jgi:hypothetical protein